MERINCLEQVLSLFVIPFVAMLVPAADIAHRPAWVQWLYLAVMATCVVVNFLCFAARRDAELEEARRAFPHLNDLGRRKW